jgi:hypothetical protein
MTIDYTDVVARFTDELAAETLAQFIASLGVPCDVVDIWDAIRTDGYAAKVQRSLIDGLRQALDLKSIANDLTCAAAEIMAARLARQSIPCYIGGMSASRFPDSMTPVPLKDATGPGYMVAVPARCFEDASQIINEPPISDEELTRLALAKGEGEDSP